MAYAARQSGSGAAGTHRGRGCCWPRESAATSLVRSLGAMSDELALFAEEPSNSAPEPDRRPTPISDWQVELLRKALDARGLTTMAERQAVVEESVGHPVESLRALTQEEALQALAKLGEQRTARPSGGSSWDNRDEDTWIDRL